MDELTMKLSKQFQSAIVKMGQECETEQIQGMAKAKEAVLETQKTQARASSALQPDLKATLHNPNVGGEAKERAIQRLNDMGVSTEGSEPIKAVSTGKVSGMDRTLSTPMIMI
ncbi:hypothetical protein GGU10DRAFT_375310 [Lentinula aff. detonsa]|uniref:Uncharacterized protein n=1 Tax=Lentinula aff. detonsa TaxID=2804958 RepID=A0AA38NJP4_9AGAR|nr:hypothetical protein GGU10DRAFT_375310 [Lentinula aff. detonsa]